MINPIDEINKSNYYSYILILELDTELDIDFVNNALDIKINEELNIYHNEQFALKYNQNQLILYFIMDNTFDFIKNTLKLLKLTTSQIVFKFRHINSLTTINVNYDNLINMLELIKTSITTKQLEPKYYKNILKYIKEKEEEEEKKKQKEKERKEREKEREKDNKGYNYYFWQDEQACLYGAKEFKLEELEELQNKFMYDIGKDIYETYLINFSTQFHNDDDDDNNKSIDKQLKTVNFKYIKTEYKVKGEIVTVISIYINEIITSNNKDISHHWAYDHQPYFVLNLPKFNTNEIEMYAGLNYVYEQEEVNKTESIISSSYFEEVKANPSLIDKIETEFAKEYAKRYSDKEQFDGFDSNANIEYKMMIELGYENKLYNYKLTSNNINTYNHVDTLFKSNIIDNEEHLYKDLFYKYNNESKTVKKYIKDNNIDLTKQLVLIIINELSYIFNCKMFKTQKHCLEYINEKIDECIKIEIKTIITTQVTTSINGDEKVTIYNENELDLDDDIEEIKPIIKKRIVRKN